MTARSVSVCMVVHCKSVGASAVANLQANLEHSPSMHKGIVMSVNRKLSRRRVLEQALLVTATGMTLPAIVS